MKLGMLKKSLRNYHLYLAFLYPFLLFIFVFLGQRHFTYDFTGYNYPLINSVYLEMLKPESFLWDQYTYGGIALTSNPQAGLFYPLNLALQLSHYLLKQDHISPYSYQFLGILQYSLFSLFSCILINRLIKQKFLSFTAAGQTTTLGIILANAQHPGSTGSYIFLPLTIYAILKTCEEPKLNLTYFYILTFAIFSTIAAGFYPQSGSTIVCLFIFSTVFSIINKRKLRSFLIVSTAFLIACLLNLSVISSTLFDSSRIISANSDWTFNMDYVQTMFNPFAFNILTNNPLYDPTKAFMWSGFLYLPFLFIGTATIIKSRDNEKICNFGGVFFDFCNWN